MRLNRIIGLAVCVLVAACGQEPASQSTDWVLTNGRIYTVDEMLSPCMQGDNNSLRGQFVEAACEQYVTGFADIHVLIADAERNNVCLPPGDTGPMKHAWPS